MAFRYPYGYSMGIQRPANRSRQVLDTDPDVYFNGLYINPRLGPVMWGMSDEVSSFSSRPRDRGLRYQDLAPEFLPGSRMRVRGRQNRYVTDPAFASPQLGYIDERVNRSVQTGTVRETDDVLPVSLAIKELFYQLEAAAKFYTNFGKEYEKDIALVKKYATKEILENLWIRRVRRAKDPRAAFQNEDHDGYEDQFAVWKRKLCHALDGVIASNLDEASHDDRNRSDQSMVRMVDKIGTANRQLLPLLDAAWRGQDRCRELIIELELLKGLVKSGDRIDMKQSDDKEDGNSEGGRPVEDGTW